jgi:hypothetical protein
MRRSLVAVIVFAGIGWAQHSGSGAPQAPAEGKSAAGKAAPENGSLVLRKLESVTWNPETAELTWVVSVWDSGSTSGQPTAKENYTIHPDTAIMNFQGEGRRFDSEEARQVRIVMDMITTYTVESTVWWAHGFGQKLDGNQEPAPGNKEGGKGKEEKTKPGNKTAPAVLHTPVAAAPSSPKEVRRWVAAGSQYSEPGLTGVWY